IGVVRAIAGQLVWAWARCNALAASKNGMDNPSSHVRIFMSLLAWCSSLVAVALPRKPAGAIAEQNVERGEAAVASRDVALKVELFLRAQRGMAVDLLLQHA